MDRLEKLYLKKEILETVYFDLVNPCKDEFGNYTAKKLNAIKAQIEILEGKE